MGTGATEVSRHVRASLNVGLCSSSGSARKSLADIGSVIPRHCGADAHPVHEKIPDVPFTQQDSVAVELSADGAKSARIGACWGDGSTGNICPLEVGAQQNRSRGSGIAGQESLGAPDVQVMAKEEQVALPIWIVIIETLEATHGTEPVGTDGPGKTRHEKMR